MKIEYQKHSKRKKKAIKFWLKVAKEYNDGQTAQAIAKKYKNPLTGKSYTRAHIYLILDHFKKGVI